MNDDTTLPPVSVPPDSPWWVRLAFSIWPHVKARLDAALVGVAAVLPVLYEHADLVQQYVSPKAFHYFGTVYMLFTFWKIIRSDRQIKEQSK